MKLRFTTFLILFALMLSSCVFTRLNSEVKDFEDYSVASGKVSGAITEAVPVILVLWPLDSDDDQIGTYWILSETADFNVTVPPGQYYLLAMQDLNSDGKFQNEEPYGILKNPGIIDTERTDNLSNLRIELGEYHESFVPSSIRDRETTGAAAPLEWRKNLAGEIIDLEDSRFGAEASVEGYWTPLTSLNQGGFTVGFLEAYNPGRIPVLFVHGAKGYAQEFTSLVENLDTNRFQAWMVSYPSGFRLERTAKALNQLIQELCLLHGTQDIVIIAHSMGGLMTRRMLTGEMDRDSYYRVPLYITISTPWNGHASASKGVEKSPAIVPSWYDMVPGNSLISEMFETDISTLTEHHLFFSFNGKSVLSQSGDDSVTVASQLYMPAQDQAFSITGINDNHGGILSNPDTITRVNKLLAGIKGE